MKILILSKKERFVKVGAPLRIPCAVCYDRYHYEAKAHICCGFCTTFGSYIGWDEALER